MPRIDVRLIALSLFLTACTQGPPTTPPPLGALPFATDSIDSRQIAPGVTHRVIRSPDGPWTINVLYVDLDACNRVEAVASSDSTLMRMKTTAMLEALA
ncbi:MAG TPA: hypothetical protein VFL88_09580, partial [Gemmatimonadales bacterium]|nr:hypothetical protein [Gemmatimonadales bacterium]